MCRKTIPSPFKVLTIGLLAVACGAGGSSTEPLSSTPTSPAGSTIGFLGLWVFSYFAFMDAFRVMRVFMITTPCKDEVQVPADANARLISCQMEQVRTPRSLPPSKLVFTLAMRSVSFVSMLLVVIPVPSRDALASLSRSETVPE